MAIEVPPTTLDEVRVALKDRTKLGYFVIASADSDLWNVALALEIDIPGVTPIRFQNRDDAREWITDARMVAAAADWDGRVHTQFTAAQAEDKDHVAEKLNRAPA